MTQTAALQGDALNAFLDQTHELLHDYNEDQPSHITQEDRVAAVVELMEQQTFAPTTALELERLHDFWLVLDKPETANALLQSHRTVMLAAETIPAADSAVRLALSNIQSRLGFDKSSAI